tara:strand:- start:12233 stop:13345 length:1113 start_codon:yes stop_codon:yes gene_type:complete
MDSFKSVKDTCSHTRDEEKLLVLFQDYLEKIPEWETVKIEETTNTIISQAKCDYIEDVLFAVFILHTRIFDAIEPVPESNKNKIEFPNLSNFIFQTLVNVARENWKYVYLFKEAGSSCEYQSNRNKCEQIIENCILETITEMLPVRDILAEHIHKYSNTEEEDDNIDNENVELSQLNRVKRTKKKILKKGQNGGNPLEPFDMSPYNNNDNFGMPEDPNIPISSAMLSPDNMIPTPIVPPSQQTLPFSSQQTLPFSSQPTLPFSSQQTPPFSSQQTPPFSSQLPVVQPFVSHTPAPVEIKPVEIPNPSINSNVQSSMSENLLDNFDSTHVVGQDIGNTQLKTVQFNEPLVSNLDSIGGENVLNDLETISYE